ncbi:adenosylmethionine--8-amino-7-oxononanoate transaminase [Bacteroidetes bacterium endosymbiont of Geopemphigus sp.]|uniref:adenosylmethionine--8-amino-7-oxononanoate transaminase n=1 Tax=Bacteroidetes bacterium endosymbiont of Geopemphigus sp. TaxID=2047937 RepID=UPI000CD0FCCE|nr:adenosylmethionine--8-amino-7-oxononanoate transaminase [Bacteroidetes bacterium endosymbiont of Geopemphigus sp.]
MSTLSERDLICNWHPYTQHATALPPVGIVRGKGTLLFDEHGKEYIDAIASWWCNPHGHANEYIAESIYKQLLTLEHVLFGGFTHPAAVELSERLLSVLPGNQKKVFYSDNGSTAVEVALKMALQFFFNRSEIRDTIVAFEDSFHGDTFGAMSISGISLFTQAFQRSFFKVVRIPVPLSGKEQETQHALQAILRSHKVAAFIFEPLVQGTAGMRMYSPNSLEMFIRLCKESHVLTIADEVMTGFGRTGRLFAADYMREKPDIFCLSKAFTGGFIPMAATTCTQEIFEGFFHEKTEKALFHGHTFMANPAGCAAALASLELSLSEKTAESIQRIARKHKEFARKLQMHPKTEKIRQLGVILAWDIKVEGMQTYYGSLRNRMYAFFIEHGIILRPVGTTIYLLPPFCIEDHQLDRVYEVAWKALETLI